MDRLKQLMADARASVRKGRKLDKCYTVEEVKEDYADYKFTIWIGHDNTKIENVIVMKTHPAWVVNEILEMAGFHHIDRRGK